jgi:hypothetical protein
MLLPGHDRKQHDRLRLAISALQNLLLIRYRVAGTADRDLPEPRLSRRHLLRICRLDSDNTHPHAQASKARPACDMRNLSHQKSPVKGAGSA